MPPQLPVGLTGQAPIGSSPVSAPSGSPGASANAMAQVREAIKILEQALPNLPTGSDPYKAVLTSISSISRHVSPSDEVPGVQQTALRGLAQQAQQQAPMQALMRSLAGAGAGASPGAGAPGGAPPTAPPALMGG